MKVFYEYMNDDNFLQEIDKQHIKEQFIKITFLNWAEQPLEEVQGITTGGSINLDGNSSMRRTGNLSVYIDNADLARVSNVDNLFSINKKIYIEIGIKNNTSKYTNYDIVWFPQGLFVINTVSLSHSLSGISLSIQVKDKMCLLNGECGGVIPASTQFDEYETIDEKGEYIIQKPLISQIIREVVNHFGGEQLSKIIISDIDNRIKKVMKWTGKMPIYLGHVQNNYILSTDYNSIVSQDPHPRMFEFGEDIGYQYTDFVFPKELIGDAGTTVCTILDNIKNTLGNFEYFYDINGDFIFQEVKNYLNNSQSKIEVNKLKNEDYLIDQSKGKSVYQFNDSNLVSSYSNSPHYEMIKNDFIVWGMKTNANGNQMPIRYHLSLDEKPKFGNVYKVFFYTDPIDKLTKAIRPIEYNNYSELSKIEGVEGQFYLTLNDNKIYKWEKEQFILIDATVEQVQTTDWRSELYLQGAQADPLGIDSNPYYVELQNEWPKLYNLKDSFYTNNEGKVYIGNYHPEVLKTPSDIDYYLDFIDSSSEIAKFNINNIRPPHKDSRR